MLFLYDTGIRIYYFIIFIYQHFNTKAKLWMDGRKNIFDEMSKEVHTDAAYIWFHFASLGEFEQGRPVLEQAKESFPAYKIIITFFSPSGYELRKNYKLADHIYYLPLDTSKNAQKFLTIFKPTLAFFTKYEFWYHYFNELHKNDIPLVVISAIFREQQPFFKWYGNFNRKILSFVTHFFVQDENSKKLLAGIKLNNATVSGDTRFDRVAQNAAQPIPLEDVKLFCADANIFIAGSTWPDDEKLIVLLCEKYPKWKFIIAPHEIKEEKIAALIWTLGTKAIRYSQLKNTGFTQEQVLIIDNIGMLSSIYQYAHIAYIGGGFGVGIHNTLEAVAFGLPVIFGPNYKKFNEAKELINLGAGFTMGNEIELIQVMEDLQSSVSRAKVGKTAKQYVENKQGATSTIIEYVKTIL